MPRTNADIQITHHLPSDDHLRQAVNVYYLAFAQKMHHLEFFPRSVEQAQRVLGQVFLPESGFFALYQGEVVGVVGMRRRHHGRFLNFTWPILRAEFGLWGGAWRSAWQSITHFRRPAHDDEIRIEGVAVAERLRGQGVGSLLMNAVCDHARSHGCRTIVLEVVNTNPRAQELYERLGFVITKTEQYGAITARAGFTGATYMRKTLEPSR
jgi:ribosomal protein S18 acetylase RimI-like enzyme